MSKTVRAGDHPVRHNKSAKITDTNPVNKTATEKKQNTRTARFLCDAGLISNRSVGLEEVPVGMIQANKLTFLTAIEHSKATISTELVYTGRMKGVTAKLKQEPSNSRQYLTVMLNGTHLIENIKTKNFTHKETNLCLPALG